MVLQLDLSSNIIPEKGRPRFVMQCKKKLGLSFIFEMRVRASYELWEVGERSSCAYIQVAKWHALGFIHSFSFHSRER